MKPTCVSRNLFKMGVVYNISAKGRRDYQMPSKWPFSRPCDHHNNVPNGMVVSKIFLTVVDKLL